MTWSNVGDEPGKLPKERRSKGGGNRLAKGVVQTAGQPRPETPQERAERLRKIARGKRG